MSHTPGPWRIETKRGPFGSAVQYNIRFGSDSYIGEIYKESNAAFIVNVVNNHNAQLKAFKDLYEACMAADADGELDYRINGDILDAARAAIANAEQH